MDDDDDDDDDDDRYVSSGVTHLLQPSLLCDYAFRF
jgi:hypothetical protein